MRTDQLTALEALLAAAELVVQTEGTYDLEHLAECIREMKETM